MSDVLPGDQLYARDFNDLQRNVSRLGRVTGGGAGLKTVIGPGGISIRTPPRSAQFREPAIEAQAYNASGGALKMWQPVAIIDQVYTGTDGHFRRVLIVDTPVDGDEGKFAICAAPIPAEGVGRVFVTGVCLAMVSNPDTLKTCDISDGLDYLVGNSSGNAQLLWEDSGDPHLALIRFPCGGAGSSDVKVADLASTGNLSLTGTGSVDGVSPVGLTVLAKDQTTAADNGLYQVPSSGGGAWTLIDQPKAVIVLTGDTNAETIWCLSAANTYSKVQTPENAVADIASTGNLSLTGTSNVDGISPVGKKVLAKNQSTASQNGLYQVPSSGGGAWTKISQPRAVDVLTGTANARSRWLLTAANTYSGGLDFYA